MTGRDIGPGGCFSFRSFLYCFTLEKIWWMRNMKVMKDSVRVMVGISVVAVLNMVHGDILFFLFRECKFDDLTIELLMRSCF